MPKVIGFTPPWLSRPSLGDQIFSNPATQSPASPSKHSSSAENQSGISSDYTGPKRLIANRGTEIFTAVGNKIRWADLSKVRDNWEEKNNNTKRAKSSRSQQVHDAQADKVSYRTLTTPVYYEIRQLVVSPSGIFLAICTEHTVHIAVLPDSSRLADADRSPLKLKTYQLGPTIHVIPESSLASVLWHPFAVSTASTDCLVTVTTEAAVRVWEIDRTNHWTFERPALAIDLRKLVDGFSCDQDFEPSGFGKTRAFSADEFDMEASASCFGGQGAPEEDPWASMTLWIAMRTGSVYALCPLLPTKWRPSPTTIPALTTSAIARMATIAEEDADTDDRRAADQHYEWVQELDNEEPLQLAEVGEINTGEVRLRPQNPSAIPRLQGPFEIQFDEEDDMIDVTDINVFPSRLDEYELLSGEDDYDDFDFETPVGSPFTLLCLATTSNSVLIGMDLDGVSGQWLPKKGRSTFSVPLSDTKDLTLVECASLDQASTNDSSSSWPMFTKDILHSNTVFITTTAQIYSLSFDDWVSRIADEFGNTDGVDRGLTTRLETSCQSRIALIEKIVSPDQAQSTFLSSPVVLDDENLGYFLLSCSSSTPYVAFFDKPQSTSSAVDHVQSDFAFRSSIGINQQLVKVEESDLHNVERMPTRAPYAPANVLYSNPGLPIEQVRQKGGSQQKRSLTDNPMRLSPACLDTMAQTHRAVSKQTTEMSAAAAELFRKCGRLQEELRDQVKLMSELADHLHQLSTPVDVAGKQRKTYHERISTAKEKQKKLAERYDALRRKVGRNGAKKHELSAKETRWIEEVNELSSEVGLRQGQSSSRSMASRYNNVKDIAQELLADFNRIEKTVKDNDASTTPRLDASESSATSRKSGLIVPSRLQREKVAEIMSLVERESAVIDAAMSKLERLGLSIK